MLENDDKNANSPLGFFKNDIDNTLLIPLHPYSINYFKSIYPEFEKDLIPVGALDCSPTASIRTLFYDDKKTSFQIKCSYTGQITSHSRVLDIEEAINGLRTTHVFMQLYNKKLLPRNVYFMPELAMIHHKKQPLITSLIRGGFEAIYPRLTQSQTIIPSFALCSPTPNNAPRIIDQLILNSGLSAEAYFMELANYLITGYLNLLKLGLGHESHAQNTLIVCDLSNFRVQGICLRDLESTKIHKAILHRYGIISEHHNTDNARQTRSMAVLPDNDPEVHSYFLTTGYTHGIIDSQLGYIALYLASKYQVNVLKLAQSAKDIYINWWREEKFSFTEYC